MINTDIKTNEKTSDTVYMTKGIKGVNYEHKDNLTKCARK